jgi:cob(I)alamin adenosyltransferase
MEKDGEAGYPVLRIIEAQVDRLEAEIDAMTTVLEPLKSFILPGGSALSAHLHLARTIARRAERLAVELAGAEDANPAAIRYLNRLSDWCFTAARMANDEGKADVLWVPGENR